MMVWAMGLAGGVLIGLGAVLTMWVSGRIAGVSGILGGCLMPERGDVVWRFVFLVGLLVGGALASLLLPNRFELSVVHGFTLVLAGGLVGLGAALGNGCTSGHGVCGLARLSLRSGVAVAVFLVTAIVTVWAVRHGF